jgi:predicted alpha/beta-hydrolase family hydrolase
MQQDKSVWTYAKVLAATIFADYGCQTTHMAIYKNKCAKTRTRHVACVAAALAVALATDDKLSARQKVAVVAMNTAAHWLIDAQRMPKWLDQLAHAAVAVLSVYVI